MTLPECLLEYLLPVGAALAVVVWTNVSTIVCNDKTL